MEPKIIAKNADKTRFIVQVSDDSGRIVDSENKIVWRRQLLSVIFSMGEWDEFEGDSTIDLDDVKKSYQWIK